jgi:hypothetical protein
MTVNDPIERNIRVPRFNWAVDGFAIDVVWRRPYSAGWTFPRAIVRLTFLPVVAPPDTNGSRPRDSGRHAAGRRFHSWPTTAPRVARQRMARSPSGEDATRKRSLNHLGVVSVTHDTCRSLIGLRSPWRSPVPLGQAVHVSTEVCDEGGLFELEIPNGGCDLSAPYSNSVAFGFARGLGLAVTRSVVERRDRANAVRSTTLATGSHKRGCEAESIAGGDSGRSPGRCSVSRCRGRVCAVASQAR